MAETFSVEDIEESSRAPEPIAPTDVAAPGQPAELFSIDDIETSLGVEGPGAISRGFAGGVESLKSMYGGAVAALGDAIGVESIQDYGIEVFRKYQQEAFEARGHAPTLEQVFQSEDMLDDFGTWVGQAVGQGAATSIPAGLAFLVNPALGYATVYGMGVGEVYGAQLEEAEDPNAAIALAAGVPYAVSERLFGMGSRAANLIRHGSKETGKTFLQRLTRELWQTPASEALAEFAQEGIQIGGAGLEAGKPISDIYGREQLKQMGEAAAVGAVAGGPFAAISAAPGPRAQIQPEAEAETPTAEIPPEARPEEEGAAPPSDERPGAEPSPAAEDVWNKNFKRAFADKRTPVSELEDLIDEAIKRESYGFVDKYGPILRQRQAAERPAERDEHFPARGAPPAQEAAPVAAQAAVVATEAAKVEVAPTEAQKEAGNYKKGHVNVQGLDITIETPRGAERSGRTERGDPWSVVMPAHYGYIKRTTGADREQIDVYLGEDPASDRVFLVDQVELDTGAFDEHKAILGVRSQAEAEDLYRAGFSDGRGGERLGAVTEMSMAEFRGWLETAQTSQPAADLEPRPQVRRPSRPRAAPEPRESATPIADFIASQGGVQDQTGEFRAMDAQLWHTERPFRRKLVRDESGLPPDTIRERMEEQGFLPPGSDLADLYAALQDELQPGARVQERVPDADEQRYRMEQAGAEVGLTDETMAEMDDEQLARAIDEERARLDAAEQEIDRRAAEEFDDVDSWFPPARGTAQQTPTGRAAPEAAEPESYTPAEIDAEQPGAAPAEGARGAQAAGPGPEPPQSLADYIPPSPNEVGPDALVFQGIRASNLDGKQGISGYYTRFPDVARVYARREGPGGQIAAVRIKDLPKPSALADFRTGEHQIDIAPPAGPGMRERLQKTWEKRVATYDAETQRLLPIAELTDQGEQQVVPGAERISDRELAERRMAAPKRAEKPQKAADEGLFDVAGRGQKEMFQLQGPPFTLFRGSTAVETELRTSEGHEHGVIGISLTDAPEYAARHGKHLSSYEAKIDPRNFPDYLDLSSQFEAETGKDPADVSEQEFTNWAKSKGYRGSQLFDPMEGYTDYRFFYPEDLVVVEQTSFQLPPLKQVFLGQNAEIAAEIERLAEEMFPQANLAVVRSVFDLRAEIGLPGATPSGRVGKILEQASGIWIPARQLIGVALQKSSDPVRTLRHEGIHSLKQMGMFTDKEWSMLEREAERSWKKRHRIEVLYGALKLSVAEKNEEAIAEEFARYRRGGKQAPGFRRLFKRMQDFFERLGNLLRGRGFHSVESIFTSVERGEVGRREARPEDGGYALQLSDSENEQMKQDLSGVMNMPEQRSFRQRLMDTIGWLREHQQALGHEAIRGIFDQFHPLKQKEIEQFGKLRGAATSAWKMAQKAQNMDGALAVLLGIRQPDGEVMGGPLAYDEAAGEVVWRRDINPLSEIFRPIAEMGPNALNAWKAWTIARRSRQLMAQGRENLVSEDFIERYRDIDQQFLGDDGSNPFQETFDEWSKFKDAMLDFAEQAGTIDPESRKIWNDSLYIPFYRLLEDAEGVAGPFRKRGLAGQSAGIRRLMGGEAQLNDVIDNIVLNVTKLADSSFKNLAMGRAVELLEADGSIEEIQGINWKVAHTPLSSVRKALKDELGIEFDELSDAGQDMWLKVFAATPPRDKNVVSWMDRGKRRYYRVNDPGMLAALTSLHPEHMTVLLRSLGWVKRGFTQLVTHDPAFMVANAIRDTLHSWVIGHGDVKFATGAARGFKDTLLGHESLVNILAAGGGTGGFYSGKSMRREIESPAFQATILTKGKKAWRTYERIGFATEYANRMAKYRGVMQRTGNQADATYEAMDLLNYSMRGGWGAVRALTTVVPFLNARLQGLYRLGRGYKEDKRAFLTRGAALTAATLVLYALNRDDERYKDLEEWDRDTYYHIFLDNIFPIEWLRSIGVNADEWHLRLPKPFEIGAIFSTVPERMSLMWDETDTTRQTQDAALRMLLDTFSFNPIPQAFKPLIEQWADKSFFTGAPIVGMGLEGLRPEAQFRPSTTETAKLLGESIADWAGPAGSPVRIQHMVRGYFGALGMYALAATDALIGLTPGGPETPEMRIDQYPVVQRFLRVHPPFGTKWVREFYDMKREVDAIHKTINRYKTVGDIKKARALLEENRSKYRYYNYLNRLGRRLSEIDARIRKIEAHKGFSAKVKREKIDRLYEIKARIVKDYARIRQ